MFLFGTKQGKKVLRNLKQEWEAKQADGTIPPLPRSVPELVETVEKTADKVKKAVQDPKFPKFTRK